MTLHWLRSMRTRKASCLWLAGTRLAVRVRKGSNNAKQNHERMISKLVERIDTYIMNAEIPFGAKIVITLGDVLRKI